MKSDAIQVGDLENMELNEESASDIRWFETQHSENCRYANSVEDLANWRNEKDVGRFFVPNGL